MTRKEHYVPQFYLQLFTDNQGLLHVYDRKEEKYFSCKPDGICLERDIYETNWENANEKLGEFVLQNSIENGYAESEARYANLLKKLLGICNKNQNPNAMICMGTEKKELISFIVNLYVRNPWTMKQLNLETVSDDVSKNEEIQAIRSMLEAMGFGGCDSLIKTAQKQLDITEKFGYGLAVSLAETLGKINYTFFYTEEEAFTTCSFPADIGEDCLTVGENHMSAFLPLSPHVCVLFGNFEDSDDIKNRMSFIKAESAILFNKAAFKKDEEQIRYIIGSSEKLVNCCVTSANNEKRS